MHFRFEGAPQAEEGSISLQQPELSKWWQAALLVPPRFRRLYLAIELCALYLGLPLLLYSYRYHIDGWIAPILLLLAAGCTALLWWDSSFKRKQLWNREAFKQHVWRTLRWFVPGALLIGVVFALLRPDLLWLFPQSQTELWLILMITYPIFSVYPQEIVFRAFFFHRYHPLFQTIRAKVVASGVAFGVAHIVFANWVAPLMTAVMGILFALTYARTGSTLQASLEHGIWGWFAFTVGLGWYVFSGAIG